MSFEKLTAKKTGMPIVLIGMMGSGKTTIGRMLAEILGVAFFDSDTEIEDRIGCSISEIFSRSGEAFFRQAEEKTILLLLEKAPCVIATGGGAVTIPELLDNLCKKSVVIWLRTDPEILFERVRGDQNRPLLQTDNPRDVLTGTLRQRESLYARAADIIVENDGRDARVVVEKIRAQLQEFYAIG